MTYCVTVFSQSYGDKKCSKASRKLALKCSDLNSNIGMTRDDMMNTAY